MNIFLITCIFSCCVSCHSGKLVKDAGGADTTILSRIDKPFSVGAVPAVSILMFSASERALFDSNNKTWLLFDSPVVAEKPDGVYEIYLTDQPPKINDLNATAPAFVNVLDLYSITAPEARQIIEVNITQQIKNMFLQKQQPRAVYLTLVFSGNRGRDGNKSTQAGKLQFSGIRVGQTK